jgi:hypothetical protein
MQCYDHKNAFGGFTLDVFIQNLHCLYLTLLRSFRFYFTLLDARFARTLPFFARFTRTLPFFTRSARTLPGPENGRKCTTAL